MIEDKIKCLKNFLKDKKCILAFSGGSDSTLLAYILSKVSPKSTLITIDNNMMPENFIENTKLISEKLGLKHKVIKKDFLNMSKFKTNTPSRCYDCRKIMYTEIKKQPEYDACDYLLEGTNLTDLLEDRPGVLINDEENMISPLIECGITKDDVVAILDYLNLSYSDNTTCLATRIKTNQEVTHDKLDKIDICENMIKTQLLRIDVVRLRVDGNDAIITVSDPLNIPSNSICKIRENIKSMGFSRVLLDITGYQKTSLKPEIVDDKYTYKLPYSININKTYKELAKFEDVIKLDDNHLRSYGVDIYSDGLLSTDTDFKDRIYHILRFVKRKSV